MRKQKKLTGVGFDGSMYSTSNMVTNDCRHTHCIDQDCTEGSDCSSYSPARINGIEVEIVKLENAA